MIEIIEMQPSHCAEVAELEKRCFSMPWSEQAIRSEIDNPLALWLVAVDNGAVIGYIGSQSVMGEADMMNLAVTPNYRKNGVGKRLVTALIDRLKENDVTSLTLEVRDSNQSAISLYNKEGFLLVGRRPGYYQMPKEDALILRKEW